MRNQWWTEYNYAYCDNLQHMFDPCNPMDFMHESMRSDWLAAAARFWKCDVAF